MIRRLLKWSKRGVVAIVLLFALAVAGALLLFNTQSGATWALARVSNFSSGQITFENLKGTLWNGLSAEQLSYLDDGQVIKITRVSFQIDWALVSLNKVAFSSLYAENLTHQSLSVATTKPEPINLNMAPLPFSVSVTEGAIDRMTILAEAEATEVTDIIFADISLPAGSNRIKAESLSFKSEYVDVVASEIEVQLAGEIPVRLFVEWTLPGEEWYGNGWIKGNLQNLHLDQAVAGPYPFSGNGAVTGLNLGKPEFDLSIIWHSWAEADFVFRNGHVQIQGDPDDYTADYAFTTVFENTHEFLVTGTAGGNLEGLSQFDAALEGTAAQAGISGYLNWTDQIAATGKIELKRFDPSAYFEAYSGNLHGLAGFRVSGTESLYITDLDAAGILSGAGFEAQGNVDVTPGGLRCTGCNLSVADNHLAVDGVFESSDLDLQITVVAPALNQLRPGLSGVLNAKGRLFGSTNSPLFSGHAEGKKLSFAGWLVEQVTVNGSVNNSDSVNVSVSTQGIFHGDDDFGDLKLDAEGTTQSLAVDANWSTGDLEATFKIELERLEDSLGGTVNQANIAERNTGDWVLDEPISFNANQQGFKASHHQWRHEESVILIDKFTMSGADLELIADIKDLQMQAINGFLPVNYQQEGTASAEIDITQKSGVWNGSVAWRQNQTSLLITQENGSVSEVSIPMASIDVELQDGGAKIRAAMTIDPGVDGELNLTMNQISSAAEIEADLRIQGSDWAWLSAVIPQMDRLEGNATANAHFYGPLLSPVISGNLELHDGKLLIPALNIPLEEIEFELNGGPGSIVVLTGSGKAGDGTLQFNGQINDILTADRSAQITIRGASAALMNWPEYQLWGSPDLLLKADAEGWTFSGQLDIPKAEINPQELPGAAVVVSKDIKIIGEESAPAQATAYSGEVQLELGDEVRVQLYGLDTRLTGSLLVRVPSTGPMTAEGQIKLIGGLFSAYGQKLTIQEGSLIFGGGLDNPYVDVRAVRVVDTLEGTVTAGVHLRGQAQNLNSTIYSTPAMAEADALSYLVFGRPLNQATVSEGNELAGAAISLGVAQAGRVTEQIGQSLGLDQLSFTEDGGHGTALVAGKHINSRLYARYVYGVFSKLGTLLMRYRLSQHLVLEAGTGETQTIDILYTVEKQ
ncbi:MAG: translocation and assembly module TamB [Rhodothermales bacterium]